MKLNVLGMGNNLKDKILTNLLPALLIVFTFVTDRVSKKPNFKKKSVFDIRPPNKAPIKIKIPR